MRPEGGNKHVAHGNALGMNNRNNAPCKGKSKISEVIFLTLLSKMYYIILANFPLVAGRETRPPSQACLRRESRLEDVVFNRPIIILMVFICILIIGFTKDMLYTK